MGTAIRLIRSGLWLALVALGACSSLPEIRDPALADCLDWYRASEREIHAHDVVDAGAARVAGYPFLRTTRFLASFGEDFGAQHGATEANWHWWLDALAAQDRYARRLELARLSEASRARLGADRSTECGSALARRIATDGKARRRLAAELTVADSYISWQQIVGLYPIPALIAQSQIGDLHRELAEPFRINPVALKQQGRLQHYVPTATAFDELDSSAELSLERPAGGAGPTPTRSELVELLRRHAPILSVDIRTDNDRIGAVTLAENALPEIDTDRAQSYYQVSHTRFGERTLLQLVYVFWFPARDTDDIYGGRLDSLIWRVTLDADLRPMVYDSVHGCGCYYMVFPAPGYAMRPPPVGAEVVLSPRAAPRLGAGQRMVLHLSATTHYLRQLDVAPRPGESLRVNRGFYPVQRYTMRPYDALRGLPLGADRRASLFDRHGLVPASVRSERFLFWPLGVRSAGAMRQLGTHAIAFVGRRHFDDARLFEPLIEVEAP